MQRLGYHRDWLLFVHVPSPPTIDIQHRIRELGLWTVCCLTDYRRCHVAFLRRYRGRRAGRPRRRVPVLRPVGNGSFIVVC